MRPSFHEKGDNHLPQHPFMVPQQSSPLHCRQLPASMLCESVVWSYQGPSNWAVCSWRMFNIRSPPAFLTEWATTSFERCSYPGQIKHVIVTWRYFPSYQLTTHSVLGVVLSELLHWLCSSTWLATQFNRLGMPWILFVGIYQGGGIIGEISRHKMNSYDTSYTVLLPYGMTVNAYRKQHLLF
jgi:hypothetical protein